MTSTDQGTIILRFSASQALLGTFDAEYLDRVTRLSTSSFYLNDSHCFVYRASRVSVSVIIHIQADLIATLTDTFLSLAQIERLLI